MASTTGGNDSKDSSEDKALGASHDTFVERPNRDKSLLQKISENSEMKLSWIEQIEELENEGTEVSKDKVIVSGPPRPAEAAEGGRKDPRLIIPRNPSDFPGFPTDINQFETPAEFGLAVITFWAKWRKVKKRSSAQAKKEAERASNEAEKQTISNQNKRVVGAANGRGHERDESENRLSLDRRQGRDKDHGWQQQPGSRNSRNDRFSNFELSNRGRFAGGVCEAENSKGFSSFRPSQSSVVETPAFVEAAKFSPDLILPTGRNLEVEKLRAQINRLPKELLLCPEIISDCKETTERQVGGNLVFWRHFFDDNFGLRTFEALQLHKNKQQAKKQQLVAPAQVSKVKQHDGGNGQSRDLRGSRRDDRPKQRQLDARSAPIQPSGGGPSRGRPSGVGNPLDERSAPKRPHQQPYQPQQKRIRQEPVADEFLQFAVYVEKFDEKNSLVKMTGKEFDSIKAGVINAYWLESLELKNKLKDGIERRLFSGERGVATYFAKTELAQDFIIKTINRIVQLPGVKARGPRVESRPNLHVDFPAALGPGISPEVALKELIWMYADIECEPVVRHVKPWGQGKTVSFELPNDKLALLATWGLDNNVDSFSMCGEKLRFWSSFKPNNAALPLKASMEATEKEAALKEAAKKDQVMAEVEPKQATEAVDSAHLDFVKSLDQSSLKLLEDYKSEKTISDDDEDLKSVNEEDIKSTSGESDMEDGEVKEAKEVKESSRPSSPNMEIDNPMTNTKIRPNTSTPVDLAKSLDREKLKACELARKKLDLSPSKVTDKVRTNMNLEPDLEPILEPNLVPARTSCTSILVPALVPVLVQEVQAASGREAASTEIKAERPKRNRAINSYYSDNYVLGTQSPRRSRSLSLTSNRRSGKGSDPTKSPSILPFLKPTGRTTKMGQNEVLPKPKVALAKPCSEVKVSQTLVQDFFSKN